MDETEKERLIKKDLVSIENRVRHAFNQGYEMGLKESKAYKGQDDDTISRRAVLSAMRKNHRSGGRDVDGDYVEGSYAEQLHDDVVSLPPVTAQLKTGKWIILDDCEFFMAKCSECGEVVDSRMINKYPYCHCGAKMEV